MAVTISTGDLSKGGVVVETSGGDKYAVYVDGFNALTVYSGIDGTPVLEDSDSSTNIFGGGDIAWVHAAIDSNDDIHIVCSCTIEQTRDVAYALFDETAGTIGTWEQAANYTETAPTNPGCAIAIDSSGNPRILFVDAVKMTGSTGDNVYYDIRSGGSWQGAEQVGVRADKTDNYHSPKISMCPSDDVEAFYSFATANDVVYRRRNGSWGTETLVFNATPGPVPETVTCTSGDAVYRSFRWNINIRENSVDTDYNSRDQPLAVSAALDGTDRYIFYINISDDVRVISNAGSGWTDEGVEQTGTYLSVIAEWAYNNENQSGEINYIFDDGTNVYYDSFSLSTDPQISESESVTVSDTPTLSLGTLTISKSESVTVSDTPDLEVGAEPTRTISVSDSAGVADTPDALPDPSLVTGQDTATVADAPSAELGNLDATTSNATSVADAPGIELVSDIAETDSVSVADEPTLTILDMPLEASDSATVSDVPELALSILTIAVSDSATVTDNPVARPAILSAVSDSTSVNDDPSLTTQIEISETDSTSVADAPGAKLADLYTSVADSTTLSDTPDLEVGAEPDLNAEASDSATVSDTPGIALAVLVIGVSDSAAVSDTPVVRSVSHISVLDAASVADDATTAPLELPATVSSGTTVTDAPVTKLSVLVLSVSDSATIADTPDVDVGLEPPLNAETSDSTTVSDAADTAVNITPLVSDVIGVSDDPTLTIEYLSVAVSDATTASDNATVFPVLDIGVSESPAVSDSPAITALSMPGAAQDTVGVAGTPSVILVALIIALGETVVTTDTPVASVPLPTLGIAVTPGPDYMVAGIKVLG